MTNDELRDLLCRLGEALRYDCLQTEKVRGLIGEVDAAIDALLPDDAIAAESHSARSEP